MYLSERTSYSSVWKLSQKKYFRNLHNFQVGERFTQWLLFVRLKRLVLSHNFFLFCFTRLKLASWMFSFCCHNSWECISYSWAFQRFNTSHLQSGCCHFGLLGNYSKWPCVRVLAGSSATFQVHGPLYFLWWIICLFVCFVFSLC